MVPISKILIFQGFDKEQPIKMPAGKLSPESRTDASFIG